MSSEPVISFSVESKVAVITLCRPQKLNAFNRQMYSELNEAIERFYADDGLNVAVIRAEGRAFSAGLDVKEALSTYEEMGPDIGHLYSLDAEEKEMTEKPIIAAVEGKCYGQGFTMAMACDLRIAGEDATFCLPEVKLGVASVHGNLRCVKTAGLSSALELLLTGEPRSSQWAKSSRLINEVVPDGDAYKVAMSYAHQIAEIDPGVVKVTRKVAYQAQYSTFNEIVAVGTGLRSDKTLNREYAEDV